METCTRQADSAELSRTKKKKQSSESVSAGKRKAELSLALFTAVELN